MPSPKTLFSILLFHVLAFSPFLCVHSTQLNNLTYSPYIADTPLKRSGNRLGKPLIGDDGIVYSCAGKFAYAFKNDGSIAWSAHLNYTCNGDIAPVNGGNKIYIVAENQVLKITSPSAGSPTSVVELFFGNETALEKSDEIIGLSLSMFTSSVYITIKDKGLFAYTLRGQRYWSAPPVLYRSGYRQGCRQNVSDCYFVSPPVIDHCEASIYISNNEGELYSISMSSRQPYFYWIQDFSSFDKLLTVTPGNNGRLYVTVPTRSLVFGLHVSTGDILWQINVGPLNFPESEPTVDSNGWISMGSLDGNLYSISPMGILKTFHKVSPKDSVVQVSPVLDCSGFGVYFSQTVMEGKGSLMLGDYTFISAMRPKIAVFSLLVPATESFYWSEVYPGTFLSKLSRSDLHKFILDEELVLAFISAARIGNPLQCRSTSLKLAFSCSEVRPKSVSVYTGNERTILLFLLFETFILVILSIVVRFCYIFWGKRKLQNQDLGKFLDKRRSLRLKKKEFDQTISELEKKAAEEATTSDVLEKLSGLVQKREGLKRKLSTSYSLGRDRANSLKPKSVLPLYDERRRTRSYSFRGSKKESVTIFHTISASSSSSDDESSSEGTLYSEDSDGHIEMVAQAKAKGKAKMKEPLIGSSSGDDYLGDINGSSSSGASLGSSDYNIDHEDRTVSMQDERGSKTPQTTGSRKTWLKRRRSLSFTN